MSKEYSKKSKILVSELMKKNIIINPSKDNFRVVTHHDISKKDCEHFLLSIAKILKN